MNNMAHGLPKHMKAALVTRYGGPEVIDIQTVPLPTIKPGTVLVRVEASAVNTADARTRSLQAAQPMRSLMRLALGLNRPRQPILGTVYAGTISALGEGVTRFAVGDRVMGCTPGMRFGCHAEYVAVPQQSAMAKMPQGADAGEMASLLFGGTTALFFLEKAGAAARASALIYGASGAVGSMAVQVARNQGMTVTAVCSRRNKELVASLGVDQCIAYDAPGFKLPDAAFDLMLDAVGKLNKKQALASLRPGGAYVTVAGATVAKETAEHVQQLATWFIEGRLKPVIQQRFALEDIRAAHALVDTGHKRGSAVLVFSQEEEK